MPQLNRHRSPGCLWIGASLALVLLAAGGWWLRSPPPAVPAVTIAGLDPGVSRLIEQSLTTVSQDRRSAAAWGRLGSVLMHYEFFEEARQAFQAAERLAPVEARWPYLHGLMLMAREPEPALVKLRRAAELSPSKPDAPLLRVAQFLAERGHNSEANGRFERLRSQTPDHAPALLGLARLRRQEGRLSDCTNLLAGCLNNPYTAKAAHALLSGVYQALGNVPGAAQAARRSATLSEDRPWPDPFLEEANAFRVGRKAWVEQGSTLLDQDRLVEAVTVLTNVTARYPTDDEAWYLIGWALNRQTQYVEAEAFLREHLRRAPRSAKGDAQLAVALLGQKRAVEAVAVLQAALEIKPTWRELHFNLGYAWVQLGQDSEAEICFGRALELDPSHVPTYLALAELMLRRGNKPAARRILEQGLVVDPSNARLREALRR